MAREARRTQLERREGTIRKLLDAAAETLIEVGYAGASVQVICARAELSQGALFRHFPTREALMVAVGEDVGQTILGDYREQFGKLRPGKDPLVLALTMLRGRCHSRINQAWFELAIAARTNPQLRHALRPVMHRYYDAIEELARELLPELAETLGPSFVVLLDTMISVFDGEAVHGFVLERPEIEAQRLELLAALVGQIAPRARRR